MYIDVACRIHLFPMQNISLSNICSFIYLLIYALLRFRHVTEHISRNGRLLSCVSPIVCLCRPLVTFGHEAFVYEAGVYRFVLRSRTIFNRFQKRKRFSVRGVCMYVNMLHVLRLSANFSVTAQPIFGKLIAYSLASINLGRGERIIKIGQVVLKLQQK